LSFQAKDKTNNKDGCYAAGSEDKESLVNKETGNNNNSVAHRQDTDENNEEEINMNQPNTSPQVENEVVLKNEQNNSTE